jgi:hypothetical protein
VKLDRSQIRYLGIAHVLIPIALNAVICGLIGSVDYRNMPFLPLWGLPKSVALDLIATSFLLPTITCLIATPLTRRDLRVGKVAPIDAQSAWLKRIPDPLVLRAIFMGGVGLLTVGVTCYFFLAWGIAIREIERGEFLIAKIAFACCYATIVTPTVALKAMNEKA